MTQGAGWGRAREAQEGGDLCRCLVAKLCLTICNPMDGSTTGFPVHSPLESAQTHVH